MTGLSPFIFAWHSVVSQIHTSSHITSISPVSLLPQIHHYYYNTNTTLSFVSTTSLLFRFCFTNYHLYPPTPAESPR
jgi:hypothetical protein